MDIVLALVQTVAKQIRRRRCRAIALLISVFFSFSLLGCADTQRVRLVELPETRTVSEVRRLSGAVSEVSPPAVLLDLDQLMAPYEPRVTIASPKSEQVIENDHIEVKLQLEGFSIYKDEKLKLGPHLQVILDQQPARSVYSLENPVIFEGLMPGSHTLQVIAVRPWGESFKNETAKAQTTFHILAATGENTPDPAQPALTYLEPQGTYSAEPVLLDFYLTNAPLHQVARESDRDDVTDWQIRCTVNGQSFVFDQWQPIYLKGLTPGQNWVQLTLIDRKGNPIKNAFNSTVRTFNYQLEDRGSLARTTLARIVRGELPIEQIGQIAVVNYQPPTPVIEIPAPVTAPQNPVVDSPEPTSVIEISPEGKDSKTAASNDDNDAPEAKTEEASDVEKAAADVPIDEAETDKAEITIDQIEPTEVDLPPEEEVREEEVREKEASEEKASEKDANVFSQMSEWAKSFRKTQQAPEDLSVSPENTSTEKPTDESSESNESVLSNKSETDNHKAELDNGLEVSDPRLNEVD